MSEKDLYQKLAESILAPDSKIIARLWEIIADREEACNGCEACIDRCMFGALQCIIPDPKPQITRSFLLGYGRTYPTKKDLSL